MKKFFLSLCCAFSFALSAQTIRTPVSSVYTQLNTYSSINNDAFSFAANQAALAGSKSFSAGFYGEKRFMLEDLGLYKLAFALPTSSGNFGLKGGYFGGSYYNESELGLAYARSLGLVDVGVQFNYHQVALSGYGSVRAINFEAGTIFRMNEQFRTGIHIYNPTGVSLGKNSEEKLPTAYSAGFGYDASDKFFVGTEIEKIEDQPVGVTAGLQYAFDKKLFTRVGISSATATFYFGFGFLWNGLRIDATASLHQQLGVTPGLLLVYNSPVKN